MTTRLTRPVTRVIWIDDRAWNVTLGLSSIAFRAYRSPKRTEIMLPLTIALTQAAWVNGEKPKKRKRVKRSAL